MRRRGFFAGLGALLAAPAIIRTPGLLMPGKPVLVAASVEVGLDDWWVLQMRKQMPLPIGFALGAIDRKPLPYWQNRGAA
jgi:hypothetical protein